MKYNVILADPPWRYRDATPNRAIENHYQTMSDEEIYSLPVGELATDESVLLLWATWPKLVEAQAVMSAWGFEYVSGFPWIKIQGHPQYFLDGTLQIVPQYGMGFWVRGCSEPVLIGKRKNTPAPHSSFVGLLSPNLQHSRKPDNLYEYAEKLPGPYLELFARRQRPGWDVFGNEVENSIRLEQP